MKFYKYLSLPRLEQTLRPDGVWLKLSSPTEFNDPFDSTGLVVGMPSENFVSHYAQDRQDILDLCRGDMTRLPLFVRDDFADLMKSRRMFDEFLRIFCVTDAPSAAEPLMWSHYACGAEGVRIAIDFSGCAIRPVPINYCFSAPILDVGRAQWFNGDDTAICQFCMACVFSKNIAWAYEREWRVIFKVDSVDELRLHGVEVVQEDGLFFWKPQRSVLKRIDFGSEACDVESAVAKIVENGYSDVEIRVARRNYETYGYTYEPYN